MESSSSVRCLEYTQSGDLTNVTYPLPNADINGVGVLVAFLFPAYLSWLGAILLYIGGLTSQDLLSDFDILYLQIQDRTNNKWHGEFHIAILTLSAQQLVTGIGILAAAFATLSTALVADFHTIIYLAWMSSNGYLATLTLLRDYLQHNPAIRAMKLLTMVTLLAMLCVAIFPTTNFEWADHILIQPACANASSCVALETEVLPMWRIASRTNLQGMLSPQGVISYFLLIVSYTWQAAMLFEPTHRRTGRIIRTPLRWLAQALHGAARRRLAPPHRHLHDIHYRLLLGIYLFLTASLDFIGSFACFLGIVTVSFAWANFELLLPRLHVFPNCVRQALNQWDFGQILPLLLLLSSFYSFIEHYLHERGMKPTSNNNNNKPTAPPAMSPTPIIKSTTGVPFASSSPRLSEIFLQYDPSRAEALQATVQRQLYAIPYFKVLLGLFCLLAVGAAVGYFAETIIALTGPSEPYSWSTRDWHLLPDVVAATAATLGILVVAFLGPL
ncbi:hypothetical protein ASPACDRAFT_1859266 [Aspergillus aculeatus ATCC 16872]|uniref:Uncharacterized protein n=1 Tax=Aspergillus aculeatus (strain ATCC 16872 / CBS 172.66 / WB 5094) TaxID=690307 RepID=A0A1L9WKA3_ASPA1|nr:uncharacterized protein ASPACDRAFT_1859266 [Aspergillus aculeatus ATCC 16872]OJJ96586.1 hypothetical protein ASPACDRAFT_1859266 [Aspergillus aculeatus ATCC 16872]